MFRLTRLLPADHKLHETPLGVKYSSVATRCHHKHGDTGDWTRGQNKTLLDARLEHRRKLDLDYAVNTSQMKSNRDLFTNYDRLRRKYGVLPPSLEPEASELSSTATNWPHYGSARSNLGKSARHLDMTYKNNDIGRS